MDLVSYIQEEWDMLLTSIRDGVIPNIDHIEHLRDALQVKVLSYGQQVAVADVTRSTCVLIHSVQRSLGR